MTTVDAYTLTILTTLLLSLLAMAALSRAVSLRVQAVIYYLTGSGDLASVAVIVPILGSPDFDLGMKKESGNILVAVEIDPKLVNLSDETENSVFEKVSAAWN